MRFSSQINIDSTRHYGIKDQWREPNADREFARAMLRRSPLTLEGTTLLGRTPTMRCLLVLLLLLFYPLSASPSDNPKNANNIFRLLIALDGSYPDFPPEIIMDTAKTTIITSRLGHSNHQFLEDYVFFRMDSLIINASCTDRLIYPSAKDSDVNAVIAFNHINGSVYRISGFHLDDTYSFLKEIKSKFPEISLKEIANSFNIDKMSFGKRFSILNDTVSSYDPNTLRILHEYHNSYMRRLNESKTYITITEN